MIQTVYVMDPETSEILRAFEVMIIEGPAERTITAKS